MLLAIAICIGSGILIGLYVALLVVAKGKAAGVLCIEERTSVEHHHLVEHRVINLAAEPITQSWTPPAALTVPSRTVRRLPAGRRY